MNINKNNYEAYFLDYHEGNLSAAEVAELMLFLGQHPELKEMFESFESFRLEMEEETVFVGKEGLKKNMSQTIDRTNYEEYFINSIEGNLNAKEKVELENFLKNNTSLHRDYQLFKQTILPIEAIVFEHKASLKRGQKLIPFYYYVSAAASIALILGLYFLLRKEAVKTTPELAKSPIENALPQKNNLAAGNQVPVQMDSMLVVKQKNNIPQKGIAVQKQNPIHQVFPDVRDGEDTIEKNVPNKIEQEVKYIVKENSQQPQALDTTPVNVVTASKVENQAIDHYLSVREFAAKKIKEKVLGESIVQTPSTTDRSRKLGKWDLARAAAKGFSKLTGKQSEVQPRYNDKGELTGYVVTAGNFEVTRSSGK